MAEPVKRVAKKREIAPPPIPLVPHLVGGTVRLPVFRFRFLFANGDVVDLLAPHDDASIRALLLKDRGLGQTDQIVGFTRLECVGFTSVDPLR